MRERSQEYCKPEGAESYHMERPHQMMKLCKLWKDWPWHHCPGPLNQAVSEEEVLLNAPVFEDNTPFPVFPKALWVVSVTESS